jgi:hypothetical protein
MNPETATAILMESDVYQAWKANRTNPVERADAIKKTIADSEHLARYLGAIKGYVDAKDEKLEEKINKEISPLVRHDYSVERVRLLIEAVIILHMSTIEQEQK